MYDLEAIALYELGVRSRQGQTLFPSHVDGDRVGNNQLRMAVLTRLVSVVAHFRGPAAITLQEFAQASLVDWETFLRADSMARDEFFARINQRMLAMANVCSPPDFAELQGPRLADLSFQLGMEIADGCDHAISEGTPRMVPAQKDCDGRDPESLHLAYPRLEFENPRAPHWEWQNEPRVRALLEQLELSEELVFPAYDSIDDEAWDRLPGIPPYLWGWAAIERGLMNLRNMPRPRWDAQQRVLYVGDTIVREYRRAAENQIVLLNALEDARWQQGIEKPFSDGPGPSRTLNQHSTISMTTSPHALSTLALTAAVELHTASSTQRTTAPTIRSQLADFSNSS